MNLRTAFFALATCSIVATGALTGCAVEADETNADTEETTEDLTAAGKALIGSYSDDSGSFRTLVLTTEKLGQRNTFFAEVDTGVRCIMAPCPSNERIEGTFTAGTKTITLHSTTASAFAKPLLGQYRYTVQGAKLSLSRKDFAQSLEKATSYCEDASECYGQGIIVPMCMGGFSCTPQNTCSYSCGVWPPPATTCMSSNSCDAGEHCSTEDGVCNSSGMLTVCSGTCVAGSSKL